MSRIKVYSVFDRKAEEFAPPFLAQNDELAKRLVVASFSRGESIVTQWPEDFSLYFIGEFGSGNGALIPLDQSALVCSVSSILPQRGSQNADNS